MIYKRRVGEIRLMISLISPITVLTAPTFKISSKLYLKVKSSIT